MGHPVLDLCELERRAGHPRSSILLGVSEAELFSNETPHEIAKLFDFDLASTVVVMPI